MIELTGILEKGYQFAALPPKMIDGKMVFKANEEDAGGAPYHRRR